MCDIDRAAEAVRVLKESRLTLAAAESCTGGLVAKKITDVSGASEVFEGGVVSYSNSVKTELLGVLKNTLEEYGAVSENTAREMALGAMARLGADIGVSTTGIAGPTGGTKEKPVGTVCFGIATKSCVRTFTKRFGEEKTRDEIREAASDFALSLVIEECRRAEK